MKRRSGGFSLVEMMIALAISAVLIAATWGVVAAVVRGDEDSRIRVELQVQATTALRKISDLLKMAGPTGVVTGALGANDYPVFALDQAGGGFTGNNVFVNQTTYQTPPSGTNQINNDGVAHLPPSTNTDGYYGTSNEIAFKLPRPAPWYYPAAPPTNKTDNPLDNTGVPVDLAGNVTWGVTAGLYNYYTAVGGGATVADRQADVYAIVLVPTTSFQKAAGGAAVAGANQLELREFSTSPNRYLIRKTVLATGVERIVFSAPVSSYYLPGTDPITGQVFQDATLGLNQLKVSIWMWRNDMNKTSGVISAYRAMQSITVNLRSVGQNQQ